MDYNSLWDIFVRDRQTDTTERVSVNSSWTEANGSSDYVSISADGRYVAFDSIASNLVSGDTNGMWDVFVRDLVDKKTERVSIAGTGTQANDDSGYPSYQRRRPIRGFRFLG